MRSKLLAILSKHPESFARVAFELTTSPAGRRDVRRVVHALMAEGLVVTWTDSAGSLWLAVA